jgi:hypothetical protein
MADIKLPTILPLDNPSQYKLHCAVWNGKKQPLDVFVNDREEWHGWNRYRPGRNDFNRDYIFSLVQFYHERNIWLFGGIFKVLSAKRHGYEIALDTIGQEFIGRLKVSLKVIGRQMRPRLERYYDDVVVTEILGEPFTGKSFCGYENISLGFSELEAICKHQRSDWRAALQNVKGIYLVTDRKTGKKYVGSAYGDAGIWSRWGCYAETGHGWNDGFTELLAKKGKEYARRHFQFTLLEFRSMRVDDHIIIEREAFWKEALLTRSDYGHNRN